MDIYLVGGAVRDQLLGLPVKEQDYVVVGATVADMLAEGFKQVGKDFPVFLHPITHDEYALARTERKQGRGYKGFVVYASPEVTLVEDLARRDLTVNAMAMDAQGKLIDPYGGLKDLQQKYLRHVSPAFIEDPLRVLRLARFAAKFAHLGFTIADETLVLARQIVANGELDHLQAERIWQEIHNALLTHHPSVFWQQLANMGALQVLVPKAIWHDKWLDKSIFERLDETRHFPLSRQWSLLLLSVYGIQSQNTEAICKTLMSAWAIPKKISDYAAFALNQIAALCEDALSEPKQLLAWIKRLDSLRRPQRWQWLHHDLLWCQSKAAFSSQTQALWPWLEAAVIKVNQIDPQLLLAKGFTGKGFQDALLQEQLSVLTKHWQCCPIKTMLPPNFIGDNGDCIGKI